MTNINRIIELHERALKHHPSGHPHYTAALQKLAVSLYARFGKTKNLSDLNRVIELHERVLLEYPEGQPDRGGNRRKVITHLIDALHQRYVELKTMQDLERAIDLCQKNIMSAPSGYSPAQLGLDDSLHQLVRLLHSRFLATKSISDLDGVVGLLFRCLEVVPPAALSTRFEALKNIGDIDTAVYLRRQVLARCATGDPRGRSSALFELADALIMRFGGTYRLADIDEAISALRQAAKLHPSQTPASFLARIAEAYRERFTATHALDDIDMAVKTADAASNLLPPKHDGKHTLTFRRATFLGSRFLRSGRLEDLEGALSNLETFLAMLPDKHSDWAAGLYTMGVFLVARYHRTRQLEDVEKAIGLHLRALECLPVAYLDRSDCLYSIAKAFYAKYGEERDLTDLDSAIQFLEKALETERPDCLDFFLEYAGLLVDRFAASRQLADIDKAVELYEDAMKSCSQSPGHEIEVLSRLSSALHKRHSSAPYRRYAKSGRSPDLIRCIELLERALELQPRNDPRRAKTLCQLAGVLGTHANMTFTDSDRAVNLLEEAVVRSPLNPHTMSFYLGQLAQALAARSTYGTRHQHLDTDRAIQLGERAVVLDPGNGPALQMLARHLNARFERWKRLDDIDRAMDLLDKATVLYPPGHNDRPGVLCHRASCLLSRFGHTADLADVDDAIQALQDAISVVPALPSQEFLALCYQRRFETSGDKKDLDHAINLYGLIMTWLSGNKKWETYLNIFTYFNPAIAFYTRFTHFHNQEDLHAAIWYLRQSLGNIQDAFKPDVYKKLASYQLQIAETPEEVEHAFSDFALGADLQVGDMHARFQAAMEWAEHAVMPVFQRAWTEAVKAYEIAIELLPQLFWTGIDAFTRLKTLDRAQTLACDAAAWYLRHCDDTSRAIELCEQGLAVFWTQALQVRSDFDDLPSHLRQQLASISEELVSASGMEVPTSIMSPSEVSRRRQLQIDWAETIEEVRKIEGFEQFLRPKPYRKLAEAARNGPVIVIIGSIHECCALAILPDKVDPLHIHLKDMNYNRAKRLSEQLVYALKSLNLMRHGANENNNETTGVTESELQLPFKVPCVSTEDTDRKGRPLDPPRGSSAMQSVLESLWETVVKPVYEALEENGIINDRIWWCPSGPFTHLPLHAAAPSSSSFIPSYTYTLDALIQSRQKGKPSASTTCGPAVAGIAITEVSGARRLPKLPSVKQELDIIGSTVGPHNLKKVVDSDATVAEVLENMDGASWLHFACHGQQDLEDPLKSGLELFDGRLELSRILAINRSNAEFVFLSACETAAGDSKFVNEAVHLVGGFIAAGFRGAIGTLWSMSDSDGPKVAELVYRKMFAEGGADATKAAEGLHDAVQQLRNRNAPYHHWVPFIHVGI